ncbi:MAG: glycoside hydrolase family 65 protein [Oleiphilaceae bacterium]|nr:glycoside hydrolase family 65 protein [Oleiphilaceae bacterium]
MTDEKLIYDHFDSDREALREALCTLGNGYFGSRGAAPESRADRVHYPGTYNAGCFNRLNTDIAGRTVENEDLVNLPNWLDLNFRFPEGDWFDIDKVEVLEYRQELDFGRAVLKRFIRFRDSSGRQTRLEEERLVSMHQHHLAVLKTCIFAEDWSGPIEVRSGIDGEVTNGGVARYQKLNNQHLEPLVVETIDHKRMVLEVMTSQSRILIAMAASNRFWQGDAEIALKARVEKTEKAIAHYYQADLSEQTPLVIEKVVALFTSRDRAISEPGLEARKLVGWEGRFQDLVRPHAIVWQQLWNRFDFFIEHEDSEQQAEANQVLNLHVLHLLQTYSPHVMDLDVGVPARGLHGEAYRGHIFWDELFVLPLLNFRMPEISKAHLMYRYRRLDQARRDARDEGYRGAMYPWQSGSNGREESQRLHLNPKSGNWIPDHSRVQRHVGSAIAFNIWHYYEVTDDSAFLSLYGAEMILEIARFWASITTYNADLARYEILGVMGPDEFHDAYPDSSEPGVNNNAYTNVMAVWVLLRALELKAILPNYRFEELCDQLQISREEMQEWQNISHQMFVPFHDGDIISQFAGYEQLREFDWQGYRRKYLDIQRLDRILEAEGESPNHYKASKQADVLMLFYLFSAEQLQALFRHMDYPFDCESIPRNIDYYEDRTSHGSTLSRVVHSWVLARANRPGSWKFFRESLKGDIEDIQGGTTEEGIHVGAMAGSVDLIQRCFTGLEIREDVLWLNPRLPKGLKRLAFDICYRKQSVRLNITCHFVRVEVEPSNEKPIKVGLKSDVRCLRPGEIQEFIL